MKNNEILAPSIQVGCSNCKCILQAGIEDLFIEGEIRPNSNFYFYIKCPICNTRIIIPPEDWPTEMANGLPNLYHE